MGWVCVSYDVSCYVVCLSCYVSCYVRWMGMQGVHVRLSLEDQERLEAVARAWRCSVSQVIRSAVGGFLDRSEAQQALDRSRAAGVSSDVQRWVESDARAQYRKVAALPEPPGAAPAVVMDVFHPPVPQLSAPERGGWDEGRGQWGLVRFELDAEGQKTGRPQPCGYEDEEHTA